MNDVTVLPRRRRWLRWAILSTILLVVIATGVYTWGLFTGPYVATAVIGFDLWSPPVMYATELNRPQEDAAEFIEQQMIRMMSPPILEQALSSPRWQAAGMTRSRYELMEGLRVVPDRGRITVTYADDTPEAALAGVQSVVDAYLMLYGRTFEESEARDRIARLHVLAANLENRRRNEIQRRARLAAENEYRVEDLTPFIASAQRRALNLDSLFHEGSGQLAALAPPPASADEEAPAPLTPEQARLTALVESTRAQLNDELARLRTLSNQQSAMQESLEDERLIVNQLREVNEKIARLQFEGREGVRRVDVLNPGSLPYRRTSRWADWRDTADDEPDDPAGRFD